ncbi:MAG: hypothetical protein JWM27_1975, partial [Gemmatimonadetes bacterium]|nr:hypothetical protein [Gemmatimonadota bacterium]
MPRKILGALAAAALAACSGTAATVSTPTPA